VSACQLGCAALLGAAAILRREQLLATGGRKNGRLLGDQAKLAGKTERQLAPSGGRPRGMVGKLCVRGHMRILTSNGAVAARGSLPWTLNVHRTLLDTCNAQAMPLAMSPLTPS